MSAAVERLVSRYEGGQMTRRDLVRALSALVVASSATPKAQPSRIPVRALDHVTLMVSDIDRTVEFYQRVFEMPVMSRLGPTVNLAAGSSCLGLQPADRQAPRIGHYCLGVEGLDHERILTKLADHGVSPTRTGSSCSCRTSTIATTWAASRLDVSPFTAIWHVRV